jgi:hypothetical protein
VELLLQPLGKPVEAEFEKQLEAEFEKELAAEIGLTVLQVMLPVNPTRMRRQVLVQKRQKRRKRRNNWQLKGCTPEWARCPRSRLRAIQQDANLQQSCSLVCLI